MTFFEKCHALLAAAQTGALGNTVMPEDVSPRFSKKDLESQIAYYSLVMALNYQRDTYALWKAARATWDDIETRVVFDVNKVTALPDATLRKYLGKYKLALQPNKHVHSWKTIATTVAKEWGSFKNMMTALDYDFLKLKEAVQSIHKKGFPYLSGPKIFNYWSSILPKFAGVDLKNREHIEMAVDTHVLKCSVALEVISEKEAQTLERLEIASRWRKKLQGSGIAPSDLHFVLWFWSRNGFLLKF